MSMLHLEYQVPGDDFTRAGEASGDVKQIGRASCRERVLRLV